jgi:FAD/FMN-containing dehydrogenase
MGLAVNGGFGIASKVFGATCDHITSVQLVTADGQVVTADDDHNQDLFWALKGAGSAFGVIIKLTFRLHKVPETFYGGLVIWKDDPQHETFFKLATFLRDQGIPDPNLSFQLLRVLSPKHGPVLASMINYFGDDPVEEKAKKLQLFFDLNPVMSTLGRSSYAQVQRSLMPMLKDSPPHYEYWTNAMWKREQATDEAIRQFAAQIFDKLPPETLPVSVIGFDSMAGEPVHSSKSPTGVATSDIIMMFSIGWENEKFNDEGVQFARCR